VKGGVAGDGGELVAGPELVAGVVVAGQAVEAVCSGLGGDGGLDGGGATVLDGIGVGLDGDFLDGVGVGGGVDDAGPHGAGDVEAVDDVEVTSKPRPLALAWLVVSTLKLSGTPLVVARPVPVTPGARLARPMTERPWTGRASIWF